MEQLSALWDAACTRVLSPALARPVSNFGYWVTHPRAFYVERILWPRALRQGYWLLEA